MTGAAATYLRTERTPLKPVTLAPGQVPATLSAAYQTVNRQVRQDPQRWRGWKLGGTNHGSRRAFNVTTPYYGALEAGEIMAQPPAAPGFALHEWKGEVEYALRIAADGQGYDAWCAALEMPSSPIENLLECGVNALVADRCAAGALVLGAVHPGPLPTLEGRVLRLEQDGTCLDAATAGNLTGHPARILADFIALARSHGVAPKPGDWVATGGVTACCPLRQGGQVTVRLDDRVELEFTLTSGAER